MTKNKSIKRGYKPSPLGPIPNDWEVKPIREFAKLFSGGTPQTSVREYYNGKIPFIKSGEIYFDKTEQTITDEGLKNSSAKMVNKGDILYALYGANSGEVAISQVKGAINQAILCIRHGQECDTRFIYNFLLSKKESIVKSYLQGGQGNLSADIVKSIPIALPPLKEQITISRLLSTWDNAINQTSRLVAQKELHKKWLMQQLLTGRRRLKGFNEKFTEYKIDQLFEMVDRYVEWNEKELYKLVSIRRRFGGLFYRDNLFGEQINVKKLKRIHTDDFLISKRQVAHGAWVVVSNEFHDCKVSDEYDCLVIKDKHKLNSSFWSWFCQQPTMRHYAFLDSVGVHIEKLIFDYDQFKKRKVLIPSTIAEQIAITRVLQSTNVEINLLHQKLNKLKTQKRGLMQALLTGKKRLKI